MNNKLNMKFYNQNLIVEINNDKNERIGKYYLDRLQCKVLKSQMEIMLEPTPFNQKYVFEYIPICIIRKENDTFIVDKNNTILYKFSSQEELEKYYYMINQFINLTENSIESSSKHICTIINKIEKNNKSDPSLSGIKLPFDTGSSFFNCKCNHTHNNEPTLNKISKHIVKCNICLTSIELSPDIEIPGDLKNSPDRFKILEEVYKIEKNKQPSVILTRSNIEGLPDIIGELKINNKDVEYTTTDIKVNFIKLKEYNIGDRFINTLNNIKGKVIEKEYDKYVIEYWVEGLFTEVSETPTEKIIEKVNLTQLNKLIEKGIIKIQL